MLAVSGTATLSGSGTVVLDSTDSPYADRAGAITGASTADMLDNTNNTISGYGYVGLGKLSLINEAAGVVDATSLALTLDTGSSSIVNHGLLEATVAGTLVVASTVGNSGTLLAGATGTVVLDQAVTGNGGSVQVASTGRLVFAGGRLGGTGAVASAVGGTVEVQAGAAGGIDGTAQTVTLAGRTVVDRAAVLTIKGAIANTGAMSLDGSFGAGQQAMLAVSGTATLSGSGTVVLDSADSPYADRAGVIKGASTADVLDNTDNTISGYGYVGLGKLSLINEAAGVVDATSLALTLDTGASSIVNHGLLEATVAGTLVVASTVGNSGTLLAGATGTVVLDQAVTGNGGSVQVASTGRLVFAGGRLGGTGAVASAVGGTVEVQAGAAGGIDGTAQTVTLAGRTVVDRAAVLTIKGAIANTGAMSLDGSFGAGQQAMLAVSGTATLSGSGTVVLDSADSPYADRAGVIKGASTADVLDNTDNTISGYGYVGLGKLSLINEAAGVVDATSLALTLDTGASSIANHGLLEATVAGTLVVASTVGNSGTLLAGATGTVVLDQAVTGNGGSVQVASTGRLVFAGGRLGGTGAVASAVGGTVEVQAGAAGGIDGTAQTVTLAGRTVVDRAAVLTIKGAIANTGAMSLDGSFGAGQQAMLAVSGTATLSGSGTVVLDSADSPYADRAGAITGASTADVLDNTDNTISGYGYIGQGTLTLLNETRGTVAATSQTLTLHAGAGSVNQGQVGASGGLLSVTGTLTNAGTVFASGGTASFAAGALTNLANGVLTGGTYTATNGTVSFAQALTTDAAAIALHGAGSAVSAHGVALEGSLSSITAAGSLLLLDGRDWDGAAALSNSGELRLGGGRFSSGVLTNSGVIDGAGTLSATVVNKGVIVASGGTLHLSGNASGAMKVDAGSTLDLAGGQTSGSVTFGAGAGLTLASAALSSGLLLQDFYRGDTIDLEGIAYVNGLTGGSYDQASGQLQVSNGVSSLTLSFGAGNALVDDPFHFTSDGAGGTLVSNDAVPACYCLGTLIATPGGERLVEALAIGDHVLTARGETRVIRWIGRRSYVKRFLAGKRHLLPILLRAGCLGGGLPRRDLRVSPMHAMFLDGLLIPAECLVNGTSITQDRACDRLDYFHVELDSHDVILAEGAPSETFLDDDSRMVFHNAADYAALYPDQPSAGQFYAPRLTSGYEVQAINQRLAAIACGVAAAA